MMRAWPLRLCLTLPLGPLECGVIPPDAADAPPSVEVKLHPLAVPLPFLGPTRALAPLPEVAGHVDAVLETHPGAR